jgi:NAD(P)-dependent dehydrogenase (short-subunit alcohol dehydrogenase family)
VLLQKNAKVYLAARSVQKAQAAIEDLKAETGREAIFLELDLSSLNSVRASAAGFLRYDGGAALPVRANAYTVWSRNSTFYSSTRASCPALALDLTV